MSFLVDHPLMRENAYPYTGLAGTCQQSLLKGVAYLVGSGYKLITASDDLALAQAVNL